MELGDPVSLVAHATASPSQQHLRASKTGDCRPWAAHITTKHQSSAQRFSRAIFCNFNC